MLYPEASWKILDSLWPCFRAMTPIHKQEGSLGAFISQAKMIQETHRELYLTVRKQSQKGEISCLKSRSRKWALEGSF